MKVGDYVQIIRTTAMEHGEYGRITRLRTEWKTSAWQAEWYVRHESGREVSWRESSLLLVSSEYELACQILGENYFA